MLRIPGFIDIGTDISGGSWQSVSNAALRGGERRIEMPVLVPFFSHFKYVLGAELHAIGASLAKIDIDIQHLFASALIGQTDMMFPFYHFFSVISSGFV